MARAVKRKKQGLGPAAMADRRDSAMIRGLTFQGKADALEIQGPGSGRPDDDLPHHTIQLMGNDHNVLGDYMMALISTMYGDLLSPGPATVLKLEQWTDIAQSISKETESATAKKAFARIAAQTRAAAKRSRELYFYEGTSDDVKFTLYDLILKVCMDHHLDIKGFLPSA